MGEHGDKEHGPIDPDLTETEPSEEDVGLIGGGGPAATLDDEDELEDERLADTEH